MINLIHPTNWEDYELLDTGGQERLERFGRYILRRPDPQIIWKKSLPQTEWDKAGATFKIVGEKTHWEKTPDFPDKWEVSYKHLKFLCKLTPFKHSGIFPEQSTHWDWIYEKISQETQKREVNILNLFGYTGAASLMAVSAGAKVTHVDSSYSTIGWARENQNLSNLADKPIRWIEDDCLKFAQREVRRGNKYDGFLIDPPSFGHGPKGEVWKFNESFPQLLEQVKSMFSSNPLFVVANAYAISSSAITLGNTLDDITRDLGGRLEYGELALKDKSERLLSTGIFSRWSNSA